MITECPLTPVTTWSALTLMIAADVLDHVGNGVQLHDLAVDDRIVGKILEAEADQAQIADLPSSSTILTELEPMSRPATLFFLPNSIIFSAPYLAFDPGILFVDEFSIWNESRRVTGLRKVFVPPLMNLRSHREDIFLRKGSTECGAGRPASFVRLPHPCRQERP